MGGPAGRLIAIGDVHGCVHALDAVLEAILPRRQDTLVFLGDLVDQGRDTREVLERIRVLPASCNVVLIEGNHEEMMLAARESESALRYWEVVGGYATINSYRYAGKLSDIPPEHWRLVESCQPYFETDEFIFTHAGYLPDVPMSEQPEHQLRWALLDPAEVRPHFSGKRVFVGHTEQRNSEVLDLGFLCCLDTACYKHGWLSAMDAHTGQLWQASRFGMLREQDEASHRGKVPVAVEAAAD